MSCVSFWFYGQWGWKTFWMITFRPSPRRRLGMAIWWLSASETPIFYCSGHLSNYFKSLLLAIEHQYRKFWIIPATIPLLHRYRQRMSGKNEIRHVSDCWENTLKNLAGTHIIKLDKSSLNLWLERTLLFATGSCRHQGRTEAENYYPIAYSNKRK